MLALMKVWPALQIESPSTQTCQAGKHQRMVSNNLRVFANACIVILLFARRWHSLLPTRVWVCPALLPIAHVAKVGHRFSLVLFGYGTINSRARRAGALGPFRNAEGGQQTSGWDRHCPLQKRVRLIS